MKILRIFSYFNLANACCELGWNLGRSILTTGDIIYFVISFAVTLTLMVFTMPENEFKKINIFKIKL